MKTVYHKIPKTISAEGVRQLAALKAMRDEDIDYSDIPPLTETVPQKTADSGMTVKLDPETTGSLAAWAEAAHKSPAQIIGELVREKIAASA